MEPPDAVDISPIASLFPHLPSKLFTQVQTRPVDILMGNNFLGEHPSGGEGRDAVGDLRAYQSQYGDGWVIAGTHPAIKSSAIEISAPAIHLARINKLEVARDASKFLGR